MTNYITIYEAEASTSIYIPISSIVFLFLEIMVIAISVTIWRREVFSTRILLLFLMLFIGFLMFCSIILLEIILLGINDYTFRNIVYLIIPVLSTLFYDKK